MDYKNVGEYKYFKSCRFCGSKQVETVIDLGLMPLAGGFIKTKHKINDEKLYPLALNFCKDCYLLQVNTSVNPDTLFKNYFYYSSSIKTLITHFQNIAGQLEKEYGLPKKSFIVEIGCNDGAFIKALIANGFKALGVDPATNIVKPLIRKGLPIINGYFGEDIAKKILKKNGHADAIYSFHSMAHIENMKDVVSGIKKLLKKDGYLAMEVHYLYDLIKDMQYDMIYHEHQFYYSLLSIRNLFKQHNMEVFDVKRSGVRAGSITFMIQNIGGGRKISRNVKELILNEKKDKLDKVTTYINFSKKINIGKKELIALLNKLINKKNKIIGYGASGRGTIIANYCNLGVFLSYIVDDAKAKHGTYLPGIHNKIYPSEKMIKDKADYALLFAWPFIDEIKKRNIYYKGKFIVPLPKVKIV